MKKEAFLGLLFEPCAVRVSSTQLVLTRFSSSMSSYEGRLQQQPPSTLFSLCEALLLYSLNTLKGHKAEAKQAFSLISFSSNINSAVLTLHFINHYFFPACSFTDMISKQIMRDLASSSSLDYDKMCLIIRNR